jgi:hypothetical protein
MLELWANLPPTTMAFIVWPLVAVVLFLGAAAIVCPDTFASVARGGGQWIDSQQILQTLDKKVDIDEHVLRYSRVFGVAVVLAVGYLAYVYYTHIMHGQIAFLP